MTDGPAADVPRIIGGRPTDDEVAAIAAVFAELSIERALVTVRLEPESAPTAWQRSTRALRVPLSQRPGWPR